ncbi:MAG: hypothetical protein ABR907_11615 [Terracidiphilus sp.]|jgi:hypothetical protein
MLKVNLHSTLLIAMLAFPFKMLSAQDELRYTPHPEDTYPTFSLTLKAKAPQFPVGSLVRITITQTNLTNHVIDFTSTWTGVDSSFEYEAIDEGGKPAERKPRVLEYMMFIRAISSREGAVKVRSLLTGYSNSTALANTSFEFPAESRI